LAVDGRQIHQQIHRVRRISPAAVAVFPEQGQRPPARGFGIRGSVLGPPLHRLLVQRDRFVEGVGVQ
jgi:hypothetical protein